MLGRLVKEEIIRHGINYPLGTITPIIQQDLIIFNLECVTTDHLLVIEV